MTTNELLALMDREAGLLTEDNWHASAAVMNEAAEHLRQMTAVERQQIAAVKTLEWLGYTYAGGEMWRPPIGSPPRTVTERG